jgi:hypothetical protein
MDLSDADRIAAIESGGNYLTLGPVVRNGDRAYGKYQVMGANIGPWTLQALGHSLTPEEFLHDPAAQDAVFNTIFGNYKAKYGPGGAARAWFAGEGGMNNPNAKDVLGTTVADYERKFNGQGGAPVAPAATPAVASVVPQRANVGDIATAFTGQFSPPALTFQSSPPLIPPGTAVAESFVDPAFEPRWAQRRRTQNPTNRSV